MEENAADWIDGTMKAVLKRTDMNKLIMNYLVMEGFKEAAEKFSVEANIKPPMDLERLDERIKIRTAIQNGHIQEAMRMVTALHPEILDDNSKLFFHLQKEDREIPAVLHQLERTLALLAFDPPDSSPFADLLHPSHRQKVASELNAAILKAQNQEETMPMLVELLKLLLWAQDQLTKKRVKFPVMSDLAKATIQSPSKS
ncbi:Glucose-induced degradation protein 8-like protein [Armadillidium nasatum]|uniref:Glucose-induced degradation protein 8-like protein n=1 Tax=Armadillidium nasatum TaxID=96803 RepID=A0A5N5T7P4_9CRUS|nr:Glucose-induced degradation protein 8-like protein [Armadillidium nasatum]